MISYTWTILCACGLSMLENDASIRVKSGDELFLALKDATIKNHVQSSQRCSSSSATGLARSRIEV